MEETIASICLIICGCLCIWKGRRSFFKAKNLSTFLADKDNVYQTKGTVRVIKIEYHMAPKTDDYIVDVIFKDFNDRIISSRKTYNDSHCSTKYLRKNRKINEIPIHVFYHKENPENFVISELKESEYLSSERWVMPFFGIVFILLGSVLIYYHYWWLLG